MRHVGCKVSHCAFDLGLDPRWRPRVVRTVSCINFQKKNSNRYIASDFSLHTILDRVTSAAPRAGSVRFGSHARV